MLHRTAAFCFTLLRSTLFEIALVFVGLNHVASGIVNANRTICQTIPRARACGETFHGLFYGRAKFCCKMVQSYATRCEC